MAIEFEKTYNNKCKATIKWINDLLDYKELREGNYTKIIGIWDDHDYGVNDGGAKNPIKIL
jgi:hypothetical protein